MPAAAQKQSASLCDTDVDEHAIGDASAGTGNSDSAAEGRGAAAAATAAGHRAEHHDQQERSEEDVTQRFLSVTTPGWVGCEYYAKGENQRGVCACAPLTEGECGTSVFRESRCLNGDHGGSVASSNRGGADGAGSGFERRHDAASERYIRVETADSSNGKVVSGRAAAGYGNSRVVSVDAKAGCSGANDDWNLQGVRSARAAAGNGDGTGRSRAGGVHIQVAGGRT